MNRMVLLGLCGSKGSGKSTLSEYLCSTHHFHQYALADPLKQIASVFGFSNESLYGTQTQKTQLHPYWNISAREFLQTFGTDICRNQLQSKIPNMNLGKTGIVWIRMMETWVCEQRKKNHHNLVVHDVRFPDEINTIKELGGVIIYIQRDTKQDEFCSHSSETSVSEDDTDHIIINNGSLEDLYSSLDDVVSKYK